MIRATTGILSAGKGVVYEAEYTAVLNRATALGYALPSTAQQGKQNTLLKGLKDTGMWGLMDVFYIFKNDSNSDFATLNWIAPTLYQVSKLGGIAWQSNQGFLGDGLAGYLSTNYNPGVNAISYSQNAASRGLWVYNDNAAGSTSAGTLDGTIGTNGPNILLAANSAAQRINTSALSTNLNTAAVLTGTGMRAIVRTTSAGVAIYVGATRTPYTQNAAGILSEVQTVLRRGGNAATNYGTNGIGAYFMGGNIDALGNTLNTLLNTYFNS